MSYHKFKGEASDQSTDEYGSFEVYEENGQWFWQSCYPGCLPDSEPVGPFNDEISAINDAQES